MFSLFFLLVHWQKCTRICYLLRKKILNTNRFSDLNLPNTIHSGIYYQKEKEAV